MEGAVLFFYFINTASRFALAPYIGALRAPYRTPGIPRHTDRQTDRDYMRSLEVPYLRCTAPNKVALSAVLLCLCVCVCVGVTLHKQRALSLCDHRRSSSESKIAITKAIIIPVIINVYVTAIVCRSFDRFNSS